MDVAALATIVGIVPLMYMPVLPTRIVWCSLFFLTLILLLWRNHLARTAVIASLAFLWATWSADSVIRLTEKHTQYDVSIVGVIQSVDIGQGNQKNILFQVKEISQYKLLAKDHPTKIEASSFQVQLLPWKTDIDLKGGQRWRLVARLKPVHSRLNEGGFDKQRWAVSNRQVLTGRVSKAELLNGDSGARQKVVDKILHSVSEYPYTDTMIALAFGERGRMDTERKRILQLTGTAHLMAISGLHISLAALLGWGIARSIQVGLPTRWINPLFPLFISWLIAVGYVWLSGVNPPALRAGLALTLWCYLRWKGYLCSAWQVWLRVVAIILLIDPLTVLSDSFWLSCCAVAGLIFWYQWVPLPFHMRHKHRWALLRWLHLQFGMLLLLAPLQVLLFHGISPSSLLANLWAVPIVSLMTVPLILLSLMLAWLPDAVDGLWWLANLSLEIAFYPLHALSVGWSWLNSSFLMASILGWLVVPAYRLQWWRTSPASLITVALLTTLPQWRNENYTWRATMLDVGHGLAVVIERNGKALLYDTGNAWDGGSMANIEIIPYLRWQGLELEQIMISHQHNDHIGGLPDIMSAYPKSTVRSSSSSIPGLPCHQGVEWFWQGLRLKVLWPPKHVVKAVNEHSCVIMVDDGTHKLLLTGDLEKQQERQLVSSLRHQIKADILQVPHHGSKTSSSALFLRSVDPKAGLASASRYNPWRLPAEKIAKRYTQQNIIWRDTAHSGQLSVLFFDKHWHLLTFRQQLMPRWYHQWFGSGEDNG